MVSILRSLFSGDSSADVICLQLPAFLDVSPPYVQWGPIVDEVDGVQARIEGLSIDHLHP